MFDLMMIHVSRREVIARDPRPFVKVLQAFLVTPDAWRRLRGAG